MIRALRANEGDELRVGGKLFDITVDLSEIALHDCPAVSHYRLAVRERAWLRRIEVKPGDDVPPRTIIATLSTDPNESLDGPPSREIRSMIAGILYQSDFWSAGPYMSGVPLRAGPLKVPGYKVGRSGLRWLVEDGRPCRPGDLLAYCNIGLTAEEPVPGVLPPFEEEGRDFQVAFAATRSGRLRKAAEISRGGFLDQLHFYERWDDDFSIGTLETRPGEQAWGSATGEMRLLFLTGDGAPPI